MSQGHEAVYEMMWDCKYCGQKKLLGLTHRFCAGCGGPQDPSSRYFPPENEKVAVHDHPFVGADVTCPACKQPMGRAAKCCTNCGSPIDKGADVQRVGDVVVGPPMPAHGHGPPGAPGAPGAPGQKKSNVGLILGIVGGVLGLVVIAILVAVFWRREGVFVVTAKSWERNIQIERYDYGRKSVWCDQVPSGARELSRRRDQRDTKKVPDGETCQTRKKDQGNGTYREVRECQPKFKNEPVMSDRCEIELLDWRTARTLAEKGAEDAPKWPTVAIARAGSCVGCEREGARTQTYTVKFKDEKSKEDASCDLPEPKWSGFAKGSRWKGKVRVMTSGVDCDALVKQ
jgi:hypothetical protein